ncbi:MAG TPA: glycosyltransferase [Planctomycetota bacterium]|nr:glycosyltransferase [Planctomycetota bacterium]
MRLGYLVPEFPGQTHIFFWREVLALRAQGVDVRLISTRKPNPITCRHEFVPGAVAETHYLFPSALLAGPRWLLRGFRGFGASMDYLGGLDSAGFKGRLRHYALLMSAVELYRWCAREGIEHVHGHSCANAAHVLAICRRMGGPSYSLTLHGDLDVYGSDHRSKMRDASPVFAVGSHLRRQILEKVGIPADRVHVTCMGVDSSRLSGLGTERPYKAGDLNLLTVARLHPAKGHVHALAAAKRAVDRGVNLRYTIVGDGPHQDAIGARIKELGLESRVTLAGTRSEGDVLRLLSAADAFVLPSTGAGEAWPVSLMEAMGSGLPVISSVIGATPEMIENDVDGLLIAQGDEAGLADAFVRLGQDVDARRRIGERARLTTKQRFDVAVTAAKLREAVESALQSRTP